VAKLKSQLSRDAQKRASRCLARVRDELSDADNGDRQMKARQKLVMETR
jgi:hypothetical protein